MTAGNHADPENLGFDEIPVVGKLTVSVSCETKPASVRLQPDNIKIDYDYRNGLLTYEIPVLEFIRLLRSDKIIRNLASWKQLGARQLHAGEEFLRLQKYHFFGTSDIQLLSDILIQYLVPYTPHSKRSG